MSTNMQYTLYNTNSNLHIIFSSHDRIQKNIIPLHYHLQIWLSEYWFLNRRYPSRVPSGHSKHQTTNIKLHTHPQTHTQHYTLWGALPVYVSFPDSVPGICSIQLPITDVIIFTSGPPHSLSLCQLDSSNLDMLKMYCHPPYITIKHVYSLIFGISSQHQSLHNPSTSVSTFSFLY